ncbi:class F sortase [Amycolatopsis jejuensis]|uniref:class F sortase n=1 Tax=Amycolatopsis jejuensis TaxID=330084 RepID=UPI000525F034|nr:class F sortase [Amycolatopsis jejuensis]
MIRKTLAAVAVALAVVLTGCSTDGTPVPVASSDAPSAAALPKSDPVSLDIPRIEAHSSLVPLGLNPDNTVQVPSVSTPLQAGWYQFGPTPGEAGPAVVLGHVDGNKQKGIFYRLKEMKPGDDISIARRDGSTAHFVVTKVDQVPKDVFPSDAVYGDTSDAELRLITCGGAFDRGEHSYVDNIIVYAHLVVGGR